MRIYIFILFILWTLPSLASTLTAEALYLRCYAQVTQLKAPNDSRLAAVKNGSKDPITACLEVLDSAMLTGNSGTTLANTGDTVAIAVLRNFQSLHYSWFHSKQFEMLVGSSPNWLDATFDVYDPSSPALYYTKALFGQNVNYSSVVTSTENLRPVRSGGTPTKGAYSGANASSFASGVGNYLVPSGNLIGIAAGSSVVAGGFDLNFTAGGGFMGTIPYMQLSIGSDFSFISDGAVKVPRRWARDVFLDSMCKSLPLARSTDVTNLVVSNAGATFRQSADCTKCHATMDRLAGVIRNFKYVSTSTDGNSYAPVGIQFKTPNKTAESSWPASGDSNYSLRPSNGVFFYRTHDGTLVEKAVTSVADLGTKISAEDDFYICAAQRYLAYFTGLQAETGDISDPAFTKTLSPSDIAIRNLAIDLGAKLRTSQKTRSLIEDILRLPQYKLSNYGIGN